MLNFDFVILCARSGRSLRGNAYFDVCCVKVCGGVLAVGHSG